MKTPQISEEEYNFIKECSNMNLKKWMKLPIKDAKRCNDIIKKYFRLVSVDFDIIPEADMENAFLFKKCRSNNYTHRVFVRDNNKLSLVQLFSSLSIS